MSDNDDEVEESVLATLGKHFNSGNECFTQRDYANALTDYQNALAVAEEHQIDEAKLDALFFIGKVYYELVDFPKAIEFLQLAKDIAENIVDDRQKLALICSDLGGAYEGLGNFSAAIPFHKRAINLHKEDNRKGILYGNLGVALAGQGDYSGAIEAYSKGLKLLEQYDDLENQAWSNSNLGRAYYAVGNYLQAIACCEKALRIAREIKNEFEEMLAVGGLGNPHRALKDRTEEARAHSYQGITFLQLGNFKASIEEHEKDLAISKDIGDKAGESRAYGNLASLFRELGFFNKAIEYHNKCLKIAEETSALMTQGKVLGNLGNVFHEMGKFDDAKEQHEKSLTIMLQVQDRSGECIALTNLGDCYQGNGFYDKAIEYYDKSLDLAKELKKLSLEGMIYGNLASLYCKLKKYEEALQYYEKQLQIMQNLGDKEYESRTLIQIGHTHMLLGNLDKAKECLWQAIHLHEKTWKALGQEDAYRMFHFDVRGSKAYKYLLQVLITQDQVEQALAVCERGRARALMMLLYERQQQFPPDISIDYLRQIALSHKSVLVVYSIHKQDENDKEREVIHIWVIPPNESTISFQRIQLDSGINLATLAKNFRSEMGVRKMERVEPKQACTNITDLLKQLYQLLIKPIEHILPKDPESYVSFTPDGILNLVPFSALMDENGKYLIEKHTIFSCTSVGVLGITEQKMKQLRTCPNLESLVIGNPIMPRTDLKPLTNAEREAENIASLLKAKAVTGSNATTRYVLEKIGKSRFVHLATHGILDEVEPMVQSHLLGGIALAKCNDADDGFIWSNDIVKLSLTGVEMVVLSACNTGRGEITNDGVAGLSRAFIAAGIPSVVVSLWSVSDYWTSALMTQFYKYLLQQNMDKAHALRNAMLDVMKQCKDPVYWAGFILVGEPNF